jgi:hypothetical protein
MNHAKTSFSTEIFAGAIVSVAQYLAPLRYGRGNKRGVQLPRHSTMPMMCAVYYREVIGIVVVNRMWCQQWLGRATLRGPGRNKMSLLQWRDETMVAL